MRPDAGRYVERFCENITDLRDRFGWLLIVYEKRDVDSVRAAERAYLDWAAEGAEDLIEALTYAWESQIECGPAWSDNPRTMQEDLGLSASPPWELPEMYLVAGLVLSKAAEKLGQEYPEGVSPPAALLYADAVDALSAWTRLRGFDGCRNQDTRLGQVAHAAAEVERRVTRQEARSETARRGGKARSPEKRAAQAAAFELWKDQAERTRLGLWTNEKFAAEVMLRWPVLTSSQVICRWCRKWRKQLDERTLPN